MMDIDDQESLKPRALSNVPTVPELRSDCSRTSSLPQNEPATSYAAQNAMAAEEGATDTGINESAAQYAVASKQAIDNESAEQNTEPPAAGSKNQGELTDANSVSLAAQTVTTTEEGALVVAANDENTESTEQDAVASKQPPDDYNAVVHAKNEPEGTTHATSDAGDGLVASSNPSGDESTPKIGATSATEKKTELSSTAS